MDILGRLLESQDLFSGQTLMQRLQHYEVPGLSVAWVHNFTQTGYWTFGQRQVKENLPLEKGTLMQAASISKPVFATAVMRLYVQGLLDIDTDVRAYVKGYTPPLYQGQAYPITLRALLSHTAGLNVHGFKGYVKGKPLPTITQILNGERPANSKKIVHLTPPGKIYDYSGGGTTLAQKAVVDHLGLPFEEIMQTQVLKPAGMPSSTYLQPLPDARLPQAATGYTKGRRALSGEHRIMPELAAAGLWTTPSELIQLGVTLMASLRGESDFLKPETMRTMLTRQAENMPIGIGFRISEPPEPAAFMHSGSNQGFLSHLYLTQEGGHGICFMMNTSACPDFRLEVEQAAKKLFI